MRRSLWKKSVMALAAIAASAVGFAKAGEGKHGFLDQVFQGESKYVLFVPHGYTGDKEYPLILFLHGAGERGNDGQKPAQQGIGNAIKFKGKEKSFPFFVIFPQAEKSWKAGGPDANRALAM